MTILILICVSPSLQGSADAHTLDSDTSERLQLGLVGLAGAALGVHVLHGACFVSRLLLFLVQFP